MKKHVTLLSVALIVVLLLAGCGKKPTEPIPSGSPTATATPEPSSTPDASSDPETPDKTAAATDTAAPTKDPRDNASAEREEIARNIKDAKELIEEGMDDDANMILRALRSRNLTDDEKKQVDDLQAKLVKISD